MFTKCYSVFDVKSDTYNVPFFAPSNGVALRNFADLAMDRNTTVGRHPNDFKLVYLGQFDDASGELLPVMPPQSLGFASEFQENK